MSRKRNLQWVGGGVIREAETDASTSTAEVIQLVPPIQVATKDGGPSNALIKAVYLHFSSKRILLSSLDAFGFIMWIAIRQENANLPVQSLDAIPANNTPYANKAIMLMAPLQVPPLLAAGDLLSFQTNDQLITEHHTFESNRKLDRQSQILCLNLNSDISVVMRTFVQWRVLLEYS